MAQGVFWVKEMFTGFHWDNGAMSLALSQLTPVYLLTLLGAVAASFPIVEKLRGKKGYEPLTYVCSLVGLVVCVLSLASGTYNPFIYFRF